MTDLFSFRRKLSLESTREMAVCLSDSELNGYHVGDMGQAEESRVREHLAGCEDCARRNAELVARNEALIVERTKTSNTGGSESREALGGVPDSDATVTIGGELMPGHPASEKNIPRQLDSIRLAEELGRGGMGVVFRGWDEVLHRSVAVKFLPGAVPQEGDPHFEQFLTGARAEAALRHPNIVVVHAAGLVDDLPYLVMDLIEGPTLQALCQQVVAMRLAATVKVMSDVAEAVAALHEVGIIHRDLKPSNVLFDTKANLFVTDFGLASLRRRSEGRLCTAGTPTYMSPEAFDGKTSPQVDVYAMGIMFYELLTGHPPFRGALQALRRQHADDPLPLDELADQVPDAILEIIERAVHKQDMFRYKTAMQFKRALHDAVETDGMFREGRTELETYVTRLLAQQTEELAPEPTETTPSSSYFDRLSEIAAQKPAVYAPSDDNPTSEVEVHHAEVQERGIDAVSPDTLVRRVPCAECCYDLRGLAARGNCPECGSSISLSIQPQRLLFSSRQWLSNVRRGLWVVNAAILVCPVVALAALFLPQRFAAVPFWKVTLLLVFGPASLFAVGVFLSTAAEPSPVLKIRRGTGRRSTRLITALLIATLGGAVLESWEGWGLTSRAFWIGSAPVTMAALIGHVRYLSSLARRIPSRALIRGSRLLQIVISALFLSILLTIGFHELVPDSVLVGFLSVCVSLFLGAVLLYLRLIGRARKSIKWTIANGCSVQSLLESSAKRDHPGTILEE